ncbi:MAG: hypothetical protein NVSMB20_22300 [Bradyrhizobium sp.]
MQLLVESGCDEAQGYYFSRPVTGIDLTHWLGTSEFGLPATLFAVLPRPGDEGS